MTEKEMRDSTRKMIVENSKLLATLLERTDNILTCSQKQEQHLAQLNGTISNLRQSEQAIQTTLYGKREDKGLCGEVNWLKRYVWILFIIIVGGGGLSAAELTNLINLVK